MFYTYGDELTPKEARKNLEDFGKVASTFLVVWGLKSAIAYAVDLPNSDRPPKDPKSTKGMAPADLNTPIDNGNNAFDHRPPSPQSPVFQPYISPSDSVACNSIFVGVGFIAVVWTCASAFIINNRRLYAACVALLSYVTRGPTQPHK
nr:hypothetical protein orf147a [Schizostauron trachyderma]